MRKPELKLGQVGNYWLTKKHGRTGPDDPYCRTWYDAKDRQTRRVSLGTSNLQDASKKLAKYVLLNDRPMDGRAEEVLIETVLITYFEDHVTKKPAKQVAGYRQLLALWQEYWAGKTVAEITPNEQRKFREHLSRNGRRNPASIDRILAIGKAALNRAVRNKELTSAPHIFLVETAEEKRERPPMGRPITPIEIAKMLDNVQDRHLYIFIVLCANTLARTEAILDLRRAQYDADDGHLRLNPPGRRQTKKHRPTIPVTPTLHPWLELVTDPNEFFVNFKGAKLEKINTAWNKVRDAVGLEGITPYSFRHGLAREMRKRGVPLDEIGLFLGHLPRGSSATTSIYAPFRPEYCTQAVAAIEAVMDEVRTHMTTPRLDNPTEVLRALTDRRKGVNGIAIAPETRDEIYRMLESNMRVADICAELGVSNVTVYNYRKRLAKRAPP